MLQWCIVGCIAARWTGLLSCVFGQTRRLGLPRQHDCGGGLPKDLSPAELVRLVESDGAQVTSFNVAAVEDSERLEVTLKVNTEEIESLLAMLQRHEYTVQSFHNAPEVEDEMRARFDAFMHTSNPEPPRHADCHF